MNCHKIFRLNLLALLAIVSLAVACTDEIEVAGDGDGKYEASTHPYGYIKNAVAPSERLVDLYQTGADRKIKVCISKALDHAVDVKITVDESILKAYNEANKQEFAMLPASLVTIGQDGAVVIPPGYASTEPVSITISSSGDLVQGQTYVVPLKLSTTDPGVQLSEAQQQYLFFVVAQGERLNPDKKTGFKVMSCMETGDADPRINGEFFLKNEGKPLFDYVVLFSANLNYNAATGKVYIHMNNSVGPILNNRERYLKPLQDKGIKVLLGLMGNHDPAGVAHLEEATSVEFVRTQLKPTIEAYGLDGVFWDDEYTKADGSIPGLSYASKANASRLIFETKRAMPDKLNVVYLYSTIFTLNEVDGVLPGEYVDYLVADYGATVNLSDWPGATSKQGMPRPYELTQGKTGSPSEVVSGNWGGIMVFALSEQRSNFSKVGFPALQNIARTMFKDELYYTGKTYPLEW